VKHRAIFKPGEIVEIEKRGVSFGRRRLTNLKKGRESDRKTAKEDQTRAGGMKRGEGERRRMIWAYGESTLIASKGKKGKLKTWKEGCVVLARRGEGGECQWSLYSGGTERKTLFACQRLRKTGGSNIIIRPEKIKCL